MKGWIVPRVLLSGLALCTAVCGGPGHARTVLNYGVEDGAVVKRNGTLLCNRPLYCWNTYGILLAGERFFARLGEREWQYGVFAAGYQRGGSIRWLQDCPDTEMRYLSGRMEWTVRDPAFAGATVKLRLAPPARGQIGFVARAEVEGAKAGDQLVWLCGAVGEAKQFKGNFNWNADPLNGPQREYVLKKAFVPEECRGNAVEIPPQGFIVRPPPGGKDAVALAGACSAAEAPSVSWDGHPVAFGAVEVKKEPVVYWAAGAYKGDAAAKPAPPADPRAAFEAGWAEAERVARQVRVGTPDEYLNTAVAASCAAIDGAYRENNYTHAGMRWGIPLLGWRTMFGATAYGWHDNVRREVETCVASQLKESPFTEPKADPARGLAPQAPDSRFFGRGRVILHQPNHYDMQTQFFDQAHHDWRYTADPAMAAVLRPALELHLEYIRECFDPDGDGTYESYVNSWPTDHQWYNGAGTSEETAYAYRGHRAARDLARSAGDDKAAAHHAAEMEKIRSAFFGQLWLPREGHPAAYREQTGYRRTNPGPWGYGIFIPIDAGLLDPLQAAQALHFAEYGYEWNPLSHGGSHVWTGNWVPAIWSLRELWPGDNYHLALAFFQAGLPAPAWEILRGNMLETMYHQNVPGGIVDVNAVGGTDFNDNSSMFCRLVVEGLFGFRPDYPNGSVTVAPQFPADWGRASITTPDFSMAYGRKKGELRCEVTLARPAALTVELPVRAKRITGVTQEGQPAAYEAVPGFERSIVRVRVLEGQPGRIVVKTQDELPIRDAVELAGNVGEKIDLESPAGAVVAIEDPQGVLQDGKLADNPGLHMVFAKIKTGDLEQWQRFKINVRNPPAEAVYREKTEVAVPEDVKWGCLDLAGSFNGDIRHIFKQEYLSPRPNTCSARLATDGYRTWMMTLNDRLGPPDITLDNVLARPFRPAPVYDAKNADDFSFSDEVTVTAWIRPDPMGQGGGRIVDKTNIGTQDGFALDTHPGNSLRFLTSNGALSVRDALDAKTSAHVAAVYSAPRRLMVLYLDGKEIGRRKEGEFPPLKPVARALRIGADAKGGTRFLGGIDRAAVYPRALGAAEITKDFRRGPDAGATGPEWNFAAAVGKPGVVSADGKHTLAKMDVNSAARTAGEAPPLLNEGRLWTPQGVPFVPPRDGKNTAFTSQWDNWPRRVTVPVNKKGDAVWVLVCGFTPPMQCGFAGAELRFRYAGGAEEKLELIPPRNFWSLCPFGPADYEKHRDGGPMVFPLPEAPPPQVQLGDNSRAMVYAWRLKPGEILESVILETLSMETITGLMGVTVMNPR